MPKIYNLSPELEKLARKILEEVIADNPDSKRTKRRMESEEDEEPPKIVIDPDIPNKYQNTELDVSA